MSSLLAINDGCSFRTRSIGSGNSAASAILANLIKSFFDEHSSTAFDTHSELLIDLDEVFNDCSGVGWDGYNASPILESAYQEIEGFINLLPSWLPIPDISPDPTGGIGLEWNFGKDRLFVISMNGSGNIAYAGIVLGARIHGEEVYKDTIPSIVVKSIHQISEL